MLKFLAGVVLVLALGGIAAAQSQPPVQHLIMSTSAGSYNGSSVSIVATGVQLVAQPGYQVSAAYEFISNPTDSSKPRVGSGVINVTKPASSFVPKALKSKLLLDLSNYNVTFQGGAGVQSLSNGVGVSRTTRIVGNFGIFGSYPLPGGHVQVGTGYKWLVGRNGGLVHVPTGNLNFTF